ncbi:hypothetical protein EVAR_64363_1 [Eumeta japonica]|uniref:Uncharacterized protein n=1 Tax=Eumeta variegata TaxID=151549 RepID=A0A4C2A0R8_EUMVA|nr:hypothetical protein EVAR_64363_1 [Eumeta japonica]
MGRQPKEMKFKFDAVMCSKRCSLSCFRRELPRKFIHRSGEGVHEPACLIGDWPLPDRLPHVTPPEKKL